ncbi:hypothetical protein ABI59_21045 [Acidobacteria bacterium Mor1]|nr:hypothetical protein ABI59_21045 [Acidobacteria bacterium Mor1]
MLGSPVSGLKVLVLAPLPLGQRAAGPVLRAIGLARELSRHFDVTLGDPGGGEMLPDLPLQIMPWNRDHRPPAHFDVVVSQGTAYPARHSLARNRRKPYQVFDLYDPLLFESWRDPRQSAHLAGLTGLLLRRADYVLCAGERQRDLWLGGMYVHGAVDGSSRIEDKVGVVPFGHDGEFPDQTRPVLRGVVPGIEAGDKVLLWGGGLWRWLDPATVIEALRQLAGENPRLRLVFLGGRAPADAGAADATADARALAEGQGLLNRFVFFNDDWVPWRERHHYLAEADLAVCASGEGPENTFAFRTRLVDAVWAGVPVVTTRGGAIAEFVDRYQVGRTVAAGDVEGWVRVLRDMLDRDRAASARRRLQSCRDVLSWETCAQPLVGFCRRVADGSYRRAPESAWRPWFQYAQYKLPALVARYGRGERD